MLLDTFVTHDPGCSVRSNVRREVNGDDPFMIAPMKKRGVETAPHNTPHGIHQSDDNVFALGRYCANLPALTWYELQFKTTIAVIRRQDRVTSITQYVGYLWCPMKSGNV